VLKNGDIKVGEGVLLSKKEDKSDASAVSSKKEKGPLKQKTDSDKKEKVDSGKDVNTAASS
jgi:hypothetical protein